MADNENGGTPKDGGPLYTNVSNWIVKMLKLKKGLIIVSKSIKLDMVKMLMEIFVEFKC